MSGAPKIPSFNLNNPKNYFGYTLAVDIAKSDPGVEVDSLMEDKNEDSNKITSDIEGAREGARHLGLVSPSSNADELTDLGRRVVTVGRTEYGSETVALDTLRALFGRPKPFVKALPSWKTITQDVMMDQSGIAKLVYLMKRVHTARSNDDALALPILFQEIYHRNPEFARECFITPSERERFHELDCEPPGSDSVPDVLWERSIYRPSTVHQLKSMLCHAGILTTKGRTRADLEFSEDSKQFMWGLTPAFRKPTIAVSWEEQIPEQEQLDITEQVRDVQPPDRIATTTSRIIRNTTLVKTLKSEYNYECQVCGERRQQGQDTYYAEGHHLQPLGEGGPDIRENIVVVCPTCHVDFDYGMLTIDPESLTISHEYDDEIHHSELRVHQSHTIGRPYLHYHNQKIGNIE